MVVVIPALKREIQLYASTISASSRSYFKCGQKKITDRLASETERLSSIVDVVALRDETQTKTYDQSMKTHMKIEDPPPALCSPDLHSGGTVASNQGRHIGLPLNCLRSEKRIIVAAKI